MAQISVDSLLGNNGPSYPEQIAAPFRKELTDNGFTQLLTPEDVDKALKRNDGKIQLVVLNSVCGCGARVARPGALLSLFSKVVPDERFTVFAGMEKDAVDRARGYMIPFPPSSPAMALFKDGKLVHMIERHQQAHRQRTAGWPAALMARLHMGRSMSPPPLCGRHQPPKADPSRYTP